jgi:hypothetical protein
MSTRLTLPLTGPGGEPIDLWRTMNSHGFAELAPTALDEDVRTLELTLRTRRGKPRRVRIREGRSNSAVIEILGPAAGPRSAHVAGAPGAACRPRRIASTRAANDPELAGGTGAGRMLQGPTAARRREDGLHDELRVGATVHGERDGQASGCERSAGRSLERVPDAREAGRYPRRVLSRRSAPVCGPLLLARPLGRRGGSTWKARGSDPGRTPDAEPEQRSWLPGERAAAHHDDDRPELPVDPRLLTSGTRAWRQDAVSDPTQIRRFARYGDHAGWR